ncbi:MAG: ATP-dependent helicase [Fibrobacterota bacterium]
MVRLDPNQADAVNHTEGPLLVLAGAGSGKTRVLTHRIARLVRQNHAQPEEIMALTFTNKAAKEMRARVAALVGTGEANRMTICTFHSLGVKILREFGQYIGLKGDFKILSENEKISTLKNAMRSSGKRIARENARDFATAISLAKNNHIHPDDFEISSPDDKKTLKVYHNYKKLLGKRQSVDFDDLLLLPLRLFDAHAEVLNTFRRRYRFISIDEFQDTNTVQMRMARLIVREHSNIMAVGDDDQGIYSWRGAKLSNILSFPHIFRGCRTVILNRNYRSTEEIVRGANAVVARNTQRREKQICSHAGPGYSIKTYKAEDEEDEVLWVVEKLLHLKKEGHHPFEDQALLFRTNAHMRRFEEELRLRRIPYHIYGGSSFFDRKEVKDILAYLSFIGNQEDELSLRRIIKVPDRGISSSAITCAEDLCIERGCSLWEAFQKSGDISGLHETQRANIAAFAHFMNPWIDRFEKQDDLHDLLRQLLREIGYTENIRRIYKNQKSLEPRLANVDEFIHALETYVYKARRNKQDISLGEFLQNFSIIKSQEDDGGRGVTLMTLHKSKGLEFPVVYMVILDDQIVPSSRALEEGNLEEERRLFYVGMTRAMKRLYMSFPKSKIVRNRSLKVTESRFLHEIPEDCLEAGIGEREDEEFKEFSTDFFKQMQERFN